MVKMTWYKQDIKTKEDIIEMIRTFKKTKPLYSCFDTETNGLHIMKAKPFLLAFGFVNPKTKEGYSYTVELTDDYLKKATMMALEKLFPKTKKTVAWNTKFDLHMMHNIGYPSVFKENITDAMIYVRLAHDALSKSQGGVPMSLKDYAKQYVTSKAKDHERIIRLKQADMKKARNKKLKEMLKGQPVPKRMKNEYKGNWTMSMVESLIDDKVLGIEDLEPNLQKIIKEWLETTPDPNDYSNIDRDIVVPYAHYDIIYTLEAFIDAKASAEGRKQHETIKLEEELIIPLYEMERVGFSFNKQYALESKAKMKNYILKQRQRLVDIAGEDISVGQHAKIKKILSNKFDINLPSVGADVLKHTKVDSKLAQEFIDTILELRTLEKWYSTYIERYLEEEHEGRVYTTIKQTGAASGRVSSDFQQFPNNPIEDKDGNELFHPRKMIQTTGGKYSKLLFIDYSQIELRIQAIYTLLINHGDKNLCRAYMPYQCVRKKPNGKFEGFDYNKKEHLEAIDDDWYLIEDLNTKWHPIDLHSLTTSKAFPDIKEDSDDFKSYRKIGKQTNFACNYGASANTLENRMNFSREIAQTLYNAYVESFPGVIKYRQYVNNMISKKGFVQNLYGRKYYGISGHLASNYLVQGSAADFLKSKMIEVSHFLKPYKTKFQMNIHDEMSFELHEDDPDDLPYRIQKIMENLPGTIVPIVADLEISDKTWADKHAYS